MVLFGGLSYSLAPKVLASKTLSKWAQPLALWFAERSGYKKYGLKYDDLCTCFFLVNLNPIHLAFVFSDGRDRQRSAGMI
jgi:hypothetical protein